MHALNRVHFEREYTLKEREFLWFCDLVNASEINSSSFFQNEDSSNFLDCVLTDTYE